MFCRGRLDWWYRRLQARLTRIRVPNFLRDGLRHHCEGSVAMKGLGSYEGGFSKFWDKYEYINTVDSIKISCLWLASLLNATLLKFQLYSLVDLEVIFNKLLFILNDGRSEFREVIKHFNSRGLKPREIKMSSRSSWNNWSFIGSCLQLRQWV